MPAVRQRSFGNGGGKIGRDRGNDWVLPHNKVSGRHAVITYRDGAFYIEDRSRNGVFLNSTTNRLSHGRPQPLQSGDCLFIEPYEIQVTVQEDSDSRSFDASAVHDAFAPLPMDPGPPFSRAQSEAAGDFSAPDQSQEVVDPLKLIGPESTDPQRMVVKDRDVPNLEDIEKRDPLAGHYQPPALYEPTPSTGPTNTPPAGNAAMIPAGYDPISDTPSRVWPMPSGAPPVAPTPRRVSAGPATPLPGPPTDTDQGPISTPARGVVPPSTRSPEAPKTDRKTQPTFDIPKPPRGRAARPSGPPEPRSGITPPGDLAGILAAAGLGQVEVTPEVAASLGQIFRVVVAGVMDILRARQQLKDEFRMRQTQFRPADNNPLKFSANVDDALHNLFVKRNPAYLGPAEAFGDAFEDLRDHQLAMVAGLRVAFESMLADFDAARLEEQFERQHKKVALVSIPAKLRYWDAYRERSEKLMKDVDATFRRWFGEEFVKAYEEQLERLEAERRDRQRS